MQQLYFVRHGNADYRNDSLTPIGERQVEDLAQRLDGDFQEGLDCVLASSPSGRAMQTARGLIPMLKRKTGKEVYIDRERALYQMRSMGGVESILQNGRENVALLDKYEKSEYGIFVAHDKIIVATSLAIVETNGIEIPEFLKVEAEIDQSLVSWAMNEFGYTREVAEEKVRQYGMKPLPEIPPIAEASAIHIDLPKRVVEYIVR